MGNLLDNALDAVGESGRERRVSFESHVDPARDENDRPRAVLVVTDTGPGLPPGGVADALRRGFTTKDHGSAGRRGIGLALVAQSVTRLGGRLHVSGPPGATFTVTLPVDPQPSTPVTIRRPTVMNDD